MAENPDINPDENPDNVKIDPWSSNLIGEDDYQMLIEEFGIERLDDIEIPYSIFEKNRYLRRKIIFGQRDLKMIIQAVQANKPWAVMSGIKPSGHFHLGTMTTASEIVEFQKMGGKVFYAIADLEAHVDNGLSYEESFENAVDNLADILTLGLDPKNAYVWLQSKEDIVRDMPFRAGRHVTANQMKAIYGDKPFALYMAALVQAGDILLPQLKEEPMPTIVPVGIDQDPHIRLVRDLTRHFKKMGKDKNGKEIEIPLFKPGATYHKLMPALDNIEEKMSKSNPNSYFNFNDDPKLIHKRIMRSFTGGRRNKEEQEKLGGQPDICMIYKILNYHFQPDDEKLFDRRQRCLGGMLCGTCKKECAKLIVDYVKDHNERKVDNIQIAKEMLSH